jgi:hypothetical protein
MTSSSTKKIGESGGKKNWLQVFESDWENVPSVASNPMKKQATREL